MIKSKRNIKPEEDIIYVEITTLSEDRWYSCMLGEVFKVVNRRYDNKDYYKVVEFTDSQVHKYKTCYSSQIDTARLDDEDSFYGIYKNEASQTTFKAALTNIIKRNRNENKR